MRADLLLAQLYALRAQVDALVLSVESEQAAEPAPACEHPEDQRVDQSTMTTRQFFCRRCRQLVVEE